MKAFLAWLEKQAVKFGVRELNQDATALGVLGLVVSSRHLGSAISAPFVGSTNPTEVFYRASNLDQLEFVGLLVYSALFSAATIALTVLALRWLSNLRG